jgi:hypothetical protein
MSSHELMFFLMLAVVLGMGGLVRNSPRKYSIINTTACLCGAAYFAFVVLVPA